MKFNFHEATAAVQQMVNGFIERLPYLALALIVFFVFFFAAKGVRAGVRPSPHATSDIITSVSCWVGSPTERSSCSACSSRS